MDETSLEFFDTGLYIISKENGREGRLALNTGWNEREAMSEMQRQVHAISVCLVRCGMRAREGTIAQVRLRACAIAYCPTRQYRCQICPWEKYIVALGLPRYTVLLMLAVLRTHRQHSYFYLFFPVIKKKISRKLII